VLYRGLRCKLWTFNRK